MFSCYLNTIFRSRGEFDALWLLVITTFLQTDTCNDYDTGRLRLQLHGAIYRPDSFVLMLRYCANLKAIRYESTSLKRIVADKSRV